MDLSVLPNNNHPEKFLQLNVKSLPMNPAFAQATFSAGAALSGQRQWQNRVYQQNNNNDCFDWRGLKEKKALTDTYGRKSVAGSPVLIDKALGKHITTVTLKSKIKSNPLFSDIRTVDGWEKRKTQPSWTVQEYDRHSVHSNLEDYLKEDPSNLNFWMEDLYTPGYDSLLKKTEMEQKRNKIIKIVTLILVLVCVVIVIVTVPVLVTQAGHPLANPPDKMGYEIKVIQTSAEGEEPLAAVAPPPPRPCAGPTRTALSVTSLRGDEYLYQQLACSEKRRNQRRGPGRAQTYLPLTSSCEQNGEPGWEEEEEEERDLREKWKLALGRSLMLMR
ncbi:major intrinsically disordered NOTCH2-binding receptor 1-like [Amia ocellicauda]|uniref:major intrinsically disordered NOTCH2-binding receptor 1-like n=1 Tax=Amia ocellicauda TaxID=2972642 RepID=UPI0034639E38